VTSDIASLQILIVDDCPDSARMLALLLRLDGHASRVALDGPQALQMAAELRPDAVLVDLGLPGMSGLEVAHALRALDGLEGLAIALLSGYVLDPNSPEGRVFDAHFVKPVEMAAVQDFLRRWAARPSRPGLA
jgi:CheY-like chemotaxis protein